MNELTYKQDFYLQKHYLSGIIDDSTKIIEKLQNDLVNAKNYDDLERIKDILYLVYNKEIEELNKIDIGQNKIK